MKPLPQSPNIEHLKRQAKDLLAAIRRGETDAFARARAALPAAANRSDDALKTLRLTDAQSSIAREYGFDSWVKLSDFVELSRARLKDSKELALAFAQLAYPGGTAQGLDRVQPSKAAQYLSLLKELGRLDPWLACACGDLAIVKAKIEEDASWIEKPGGPLNLPPLIAATHSSLIQLDDYADNIRELVRVLLDAGADPNTAIPSRAPPASLENPSKDHSLSALYGAAGVNHDAGLTRILLDAGAEPNDNESLYHAVETDVVEVLRLLLDGGAVVSGTNAVFHALDYDRIEALDLLLPKAKAEGDTDPDRMLLWAIRRRRSAAHIHRLLDAGADPKAKTRDGVIAFVYANRLGLPEIAKVLEQAGGGEALSETDQFVAACARGDGGAARALVAKNLKLVSQLEPAQLKVLPELAANGCGEAVRVMAEVGWPLETRGGDWNASALNQAVFRGDAELVEALLSHGADWTSEHGYGDNACGTLSWASHNKPAPHGDWCGCAKALVAHGMPTAQRDPNDPAYVLVGGVRRQFSDEVTDVLLSEAGA